MLSIWTSLNFFHMVTYYPFPKPAFVFTCLQYKSIQNTVEKGEFAHNRQFLLFHSVFYPFGELSASFYSSVSLSVGPPVR